MRALRLAVGLGILALLVARLGTGPFLDGVRRVDAGSLALAATAVAVATLCSAWRWSLVARGLGVAVPVRGAVAAYYRSQFLNAILPGGVVGDVHRAVLHGRDAGDLGRTARAVAWERSSGLVIHVALTLLVLVVVPSPVRSSAVPLAVVAATVVTGASVAGLVASRQRRGLPGRVARTLGADLRGVLLARPVWPGVLVASAVVAVAHAAVFMVAARAVGTPAPAGALLPLAFLVLAVGAVPLNVAGWGPREGAAAWVFGAAALGAAQGVTVATAYGVMALFATLPGAVVLVGGWLARRPPRVRRVAPVEEAARG